MLVVGNNNGESPFKSVDIRIVLNSFNIFQIAMTSNIPSAMCLCADNLTVKVSSLVCSGLVFQLDGVYLIIELYPDINVSRFL